MQTKIKFDLDEKRFHAAEHFKTEKQLRTGSFRRVLSAGFSQVEMQKQEQPGKICLVTRTCTFDLSFLFEE